MATQEEPEGQEPPPSVETDDVLKLRALYLSSVEIGGGQVLSNVDIISLYDSFEKNIQKIKNLIFLPLGLVYVGRARTIALTEAYNELLGPGTFDPERYLKNRREIDWMRDVMTIKVHERLKKSGELGIANVIDVDDVCLLLGYTSHAKQGTAAFLEAILLNTWTTFETLAGDLWEVAVNNNPKDLALLKGKPRRIAARAKTKLEKIEREGMISQPSDRNEEESGKISLRDIQRVTRGTFDLSRCMGTIHRSRFAFNKLSGIREAYSRAFAENSQGIDGSLADQALDALSLVRNLIVHQAGIADDTYLGASKGIAMSPSLSRGQQLIVDGELVHTLIVPVIRVCMDLITSVDVLLAPNNTIDSSEV